MSGPAEGGGAASRGCLRNGNPSGDPSTAPQCGANTRGGVPCRSPAMPNGRCRMHGGASTGPKTVEGRHLCGQAKWKHGFYAKTAVETRRRMRELLAEYRNALARIQ